MRLIGLDTVVPGKGHGEMDAPRLAWLKARLDEQPDRPTFIFMHHPPFPTGLQHMDSINCRNGAGDGRDAEAAATTSSASPAAITTARSRSAGPARSARWRPASPTRSCST